MDKELLIAKYLSNTLSEDESNTFNQLLESDHEFKEEVAFQKRVKLAATKKGNDQLKSRLQALEIDTKSKPNNTILWLAAALIITLLTCGLYFFNTEYSSDELFANYYEPAKNIVHPIVRDLDDDNLKTKAFIAYEKKDYNTAQKLFSTLYNSTKESELLFYEAITLLENNKIDAAIKKLKTHKNYNDMLSPKTNWYLALAYLKNDNVEKAKLILSEIIRDEKSYKIKEAKKLFKKI